MRFVSAFSKCLLFIMVSFSITHSYAQSALDKRVSAIVRAMTNEEKINQLINNSFGGTPSNERLAIPGFLMDDGPHGVRFAADRHERTATAFPTGIAMASTWDEAIAQKVGHAMGLEFRAFNRSQQLGPCVDLCRDPRGGRSAESGGEDPYLAGHVGKAVAIGIQSTPVIATVKHFMGESKQVNRHHMDVLATDRWLMDFGGYNFRTVIQEAGVMSLMAAYNLINGEKCCENSHLLTGVARGRWGYPFYVVSDWDAIFDSGKALKAGTDICMGSNKYATDLPALVANGTINTDELDKAVTHVIRTKILQGLLDYYPTGSDMNAKTMEINAINLEAARKSVILLKNERTVLPLKKDGIKIALIGPTAEGENLNCFGSSETFPPYAVSLRKGIENHVKNAGVLFARGCDINSSSREGFAQAKKIAQEADVVIFAGGLDYTQEGEGFGIGVDRVGGSVALPSIQQELINEIATVNPNIIAVIQSGGVCGLHQSIGNIRGLLYSFYAGQEAGNALAEVIFGDYNPAGRMPVTMPVADNDLPAWDEDIFRKFTENMDGGYRYFDAKGIVPEFAFGSGMSYSSFEYSNLKVPEQIVAGQPFSVTVCVKNTGKMIGEEVVQLYMGFPGFEKIWMPLKQLRGFQRVQIEPGKTRKITFQFCADDFYYWDGTAYQQPVGNCSIQVGGASDRLVQSAVIRLIDGEKRPDLKITQVYSMPRYPLMGQKVSFYALVKNQGSAPAKSGYTVRFLIDGKYVSSSDTLVSEIAPGQVKLISSAHEWDAKDIGHYQLSSVVQVSGNQREWDASNNTHKRMLEVFPAQLAPSITNLAYHKPIINSLKSGVVKTILATDGDYQSGWQSESTEKDSLIVDLSLMAQLRGGTIYWGDSYAKEIVVQASVDGLKWITLESKFSPKERTHMFSALENTKARYLKIVMKQAVSTVRTKIGFMVNELEVTGSISQSFPKIQLKPVEKQLFLPYAKTIFNAALSGDPLKEEKLHYSWRQTGGPASAFIEDSLSAVTMVHFSVPGCYKFILMVGNEIGANSKEFEITVSNSSPMTDLAYRKPTWSSGVESTFTSSEMAVDGDMKTRWSSGFNDGEWWMIDLQHSVLASELTIVWEGAYAKNFSVQTSSDKMTWKHFYSTQSADGGITKISNPSVDAFRYVRVNCEKRATPYGSSFYDFNLKGVYATSINNVPVAKAGMDRFVTTPKILLDGSSSFDADDKSLCFHWEQVAGPVPASFDQKDQAAIHVELSRKGTYFFKLTVDDGKDTDFDLVRIVY